MDQEGSVIGIDEVEYLPESETVRAKFDQTETTATMAVIEALAAVRDVDPLELDSLYPTIDPDALDELMSVRHDSTGDVHVSFTLGEETITVHSYGIIDITPAHGPEEPSREDRQ